MTLKWYSPGNDVWFAFDITEGNSDDWDCVAEVHWCEKGYFCCMFEDEFEAFSRVGDFCETAEIAKAQAESLYLATLHEEFENN